MSRNTNFDGFAGLRSDRLKSRPLFVLSGEEGERLAEFHSCETSTVPELPLSSGSSAPGIHQSPQELVIVDGSCTELRRLHSELTLFERSSAEVVFVMLYPQADHITNPLQLIRETVFQYEDLSAIHLLLRVEAGELIFGRELVSTQTLLGDSTQQVRWRDALSEGALVQCYEPLSDYVPGRQVIRSELVHPLRLPPVLMAVEQEALIFAGNDTAVQVTESVLTLSPESGTIAAATVKISGGFVAGEDELVYLPDVTTDAVANIISGSFDSENGVLELSGTASPMIYGEALKKVYFVNNSCNPADHLREIEMTVSDAGVVSNVVTRPVTVYPLDSSHTICELSESSHKGSFSDSIRALDSSACSGEWTAIDTLFTIIEPAYGFDVLKNGEPVFSFMRSDIEKGTIFLTQDSLDVASGTIYLEVDDGNRAVYGVVVSVGEFGATPDHGVNTVAGPESPFTAEPRHLRPESGASP